MNSNESVLSGKEYFKSAFSVDCVIFGFDEADLKVLLIQADAEPYIGRWSLVGDLVHPTEDLDEAAARVLLERTGLNNVYLEQVKTFGKVDRHPEGRVITIAYYSLVKISDFKLNGNLLDNNASWHSMKNLRSLAYDHDDILRVCYERLKQRVKTQPVGFELLPPKFTLTELQYLYEAILGEELDKRNFRKKILGMNFLVDLNEMQQGVAHRPARLYKFDPERYSNLKGEGMNFELNAPKPKKKTDNN